jgi:hypothetical protein
MGEPGQPVGGGAEVEGRQVRQGEGGVRSCIGELGYGLGHLDGESQAVRDEQEGGQEPGDGGGQGGGAVVGQPVVAA